MNIIEKKCPNCHANLEFDVGEQNVECPSCRRKYAIEYDKDFVDPEVRILAKDAQLSVLKSVKRGQTMQRILMPIFIIFFIAMTAVIVWRIIETQKEFDKTKQEINNSRIESERNLNQ